MDRIVRRTAFLIVLVLWVVIVLPLWLGAVIVLVVLAAFVMIGSLVSGSGSTHLPSEFDEIANLWSNGLKTILAGLKGEMATRALTTRRAFWQRLFGLFVLSALFWVPVLFLIF